MTGEEAVRRQHPPLTAAGEPYAGVMDELGYPVEEPWPVVEGNDRYPDDVNLVRQALACIGFEAVIVLEHGVIYGEQISRSDLSTDWTILQAGSGRWLVCVKYDLRSSEGTRAEWRVRAAELGCAVVFLERGAMHRQEVWDGIRSSLEFAGLGALPAEPPGDEVAGGETAEQPQEQAEEQATEQGDSPGIPGENALATHQEDAAAGAARQEYAHERDELDRLVALAKPQEPARGADQAGRALRTREDPGERSEAGRDLARRRWSSRGT